MGRNPPHTKHWRRQHPAAGRFRASRQDLLGQLGEDCMCLGMLWHIWMDARCTRHDAGPI